MLHTTNEIIMYAPADDVYRLAADVYRWPELLSHYRYVHAVASTGESRPGRRWVKMAARRTGIPVSWTSIQDLDPERRLVCYRHIGGVTVGMDVVWRIQETGSGVRVTIEHDLPSPRWWIRPAPIRWIVGKVFIEHVAAKTLRGIKKQAEARAAGVPA